jgi:hypothetical protein
MDCPPFAPVINWFDGDPEVIFVPFTNMPPFVVEDVPQNTDGVLNIPVGVGLT